jgi:hypothetical protein
VSASWSMRRMPRTPRRFSSARSLQAKRNTDRDDVDPRGFPRRLARSRWVRGHRPHRADGESELRSSPRSRRPAARHTPLSLLFRRELNNSDPDAHPTRSPHREVILLDNTGGTARSSKRSHLEARYVVSFIRDDIIDSGRCILAIADGSELTSWRSTGGKPGVVTRRMRRHAFVRMRGLSPERTRDPTRRGARICDRA